MNGGAAEKPASYFLELEAFLPPEQVMEGKVGQDLFDRGNNDDDDDERSVYDRCCGGSSYISRSEALKMKGALSLSLG